MTDHRPEHNRRLFLGATLALVASTGTSTRLLAQSARLVPTPECQPGRTTATQTEGPFYSPRTPLKTSFRADAAGQPIVLEGYVLSTDCKPLAGAWLDFWQADPMGDYDNAGSRLRGHQFTDAQGRYRLETILPAVYPGRTRHIHVKLRARAGGRVLTTQTYFPGEAGNARDSLYQPELEARRSGDALRMDYVLPG